MAYSFANDDDQTVLVAAPAHVKLEAWKSDLETNFITFEAIPDMKIELTNSFAAGGHEYSEWVLSGTDVGLFKTNKAFSFHGASISDIAGGKFARNLDYYDLSVVMKQVGLLPSQPEQGEPRTH